MAEQRSPEKDYFSRRDPSSAQATPRARPLPSEPYRPRLASDIPGSPTSPRTPRTPLLGRSLSSNFNSPGLGFRQDDDWYIFEFSHRFLRAGLGGEAEPRSLYKFGPESSQRTGDHSQWLSNPLSQTSVLDDETLGSWASPHELWQMDLRNVDLALVGDRIERALCEAIRDHVLVLDDTKKRKVMLILPPVMPRPLLSLLCTKIFETYPAPPSITLVNSPVMCTAAAGLRSALVVDIGWAATTVSAVYEYRDVKQFLSTRAMRYLSWTMKRAVESEHAKGSTQEPQAALKVSFEDAAEIVQRLAWVHKSPADDDSAQSPCKQIPLTSTSSAASVTIAFEDLARVTETSLLDSKQEKALVDDDHELSLPSLIYHSLLKLPIDVREVCLQRIIFTGGGSSIPCLRARVLEDVNGIILTRGWDDVENYGSAKRIPRPRTVRRSEGPIAKESILNLPSHDRNKDDDKHTNAPAHQQPQLVDSVLTRIRSRALANQSGRSVSTVLLQTDPTGRNAATKAPLASVSGLEEANPGLQLRSVSSLGAWAGASLLTGLRIPGLVEIERERFLHHGLQGGSTTTEDKHKSMPQQTQRQSLGAGLGTSTTAWTLGVWA